MNWRGMAWHGMPGSDRGSDGPKVPLLGSDSDEDSEFSRKLIPDNLKITVFVIIIDVF